VTEDEARGPGQYAAFVGMCLIWGTTFLAIRIGSEAVPPLWGATLRLIVAAILNVSVALLTRARWPRGVALRAIATFGFLNLGVNFALLYWGELRVPSGIAAIFYATVPLTTACSEGDGQRWPDDSGLRERPEGRGPATGRIRVRELALLRRDGQNHGRRSFSIRE